MSAVGDARKRTEAAQSSPGVGGVLTSLTAAERVELLDASCRAHRPGTESFVCRPCFDAEVAVLERIIARVEAKAREEALRDAADDLEPLIDNQHPDALNPDQWLRDRADQWVTP
jgi:hypothetical protein